MKNESGYRLLKLDSVMNVREDDLIIFFHYYTFGVGWKTTYIWRLSRPVTRYGFGNGLRWVVD
jgi:hypothetical protein